MTLLEFKDHVASLPNGAKFDYSISNPFSWRGIYAEVAFSIEDIPCTKKDILDKIEMAYNETFQGYKGGDFQYNDYTEIHFEESIGSYTDGDYCVNKIAEIAKEEVPHDNEERLVKLIFVKL